MRALWCIGLVLLAAAVCGDGVVDDSLGTDLPVSPTGGMPAMTPQSEPVYAFSDAGDMLWTPKPEEVAIQSLSDGGAPDAGPVAPATGPCADIVNRILHRKAYLRALEQEANQVGWAKAPHDYCQMHPNEVECRRPPTAVEQSVDERVVDPSDPPAEFDAWIVRWNRALAACRRATGRQPAASAPSR